MDYDQPDSMNHQKFVVIMIILFIVAAATGYMGYRQFMKWHTNELQTAVIEEQQKMAEKSAELEYQIIELRNKLAMMEPAPVPEDRLTEVFGKSQADLQTEPDLSCDTLKNQVTSFFGYLQQGSEAGADMTEKPLSDVFVQMVRALSANPPMVVDETRDIVSLKHNQAHFFKILGKNRIEMIQKILMAENDVLEHAMADFYTYYAAGDCCRNDDEACVSLNTLYEYAGFFMDTFAGKSYLFRRSSAIRCLTDYYAVLILDRANDEGINPYGIDIRPYIDLTRDNIASQNNLIFQDQYLNKLAGLQEKYHR